MNIKLLKNNTGEASQCREYIRSHRNVNLYQLQGWCRTIKSVYGHNYYSLIAENTASQVTGLLRLVHLKHYIFGNRLVSLPYFDAGGMLCEDEASGRALIRRTLELGAELGADFIELRQDRAMPWINAVIDDAATHTAAEGAHPAGTEAMGCDTKVDKVRMILTLPDTAETLMKSFKAKLRSQIKRPLKDGLYAKHGREELLDDFYKVFCVNMRDLGSPVHSKRMMQHVLQDFPETSRIIIIYKETRPVACSLVVGFRDYLGNPWASSLREFSRSAPNMLLYWTMLEYACDHGFKYFDFGRSTPGEGTYRFKQQWGAEPDQLFWYKIGITKPVGGTGASTKEKFGRFIDIWRKLPQSVADFAGPRIRKHIDL